MPPIWSSRKVIPSGYSQVAVHLTGPNSVHPPMFTMGVSTESTSDIGVALAAWMSDATVGFVANVLYEPYTVDRLVIRNDNGTFEVPLSTPGERVGEDLLTPGVSSLVKLITNSAGRRGRGRMYWPGVLGDGDVDNAGTIDNTTTERLQDCADLLLASVAAEGFDLVLLHSYRWPYGDADPGQPVGFPAPTPVTAALAQRTCATQRRRQR